MRGTQGSNRRQRADLPDRLKCHLKGARTLDQHLAMYREMLDTYRALGVTHLDGVTVYHHAAILDPKTKRINHVTRVGKDKLKDFTIDQPYDCAADEYDRKRKDDQNRR